GKSRTRSGGCAERRSRWAGAGKAVVGGKRPCQALRQRVPPTGAQSGLAQETGRPGVAADERVEAAMCLVEQVELAVGAAGDDRRHARRLAAKAALDRDDQALERCRR